MNISQCTFDAPFREGYIADCYVTLNGIFQIVISIYRNQNIRSRQSVLEVEWPDLVLIVDEYSRRCIDNEILDRYSEWRYEENERL